MKRKIDTDHEIAKVAEGVSGTWKIIATMISIAVFGGGAFLFVSQTKNTNTLVNDVVVKELKAIRTTVDSGFVVQGKQIKEIIVVQGSTNESITKQEEAITTLKDVVLDQATKDNSPEELYQIFKKLWGEEEKKNKIEDKTLLGISITETQLTP